MRSGKVLTMLLCAWMGAGIWGCAQENKTQSEGDTTETEISSQTQATDTKNESEDEATKTTSENEIQDNKAFSANENISKGLLRKTVYALVSAAENSTLNYWSEYGYIQDIEDGRGYAAGIIGFTSGTGDLLEVIELYTKLSPGNALASYIPALKKVNGTESHEGLGEPFCKAWKEAAQKPAMIQAQNDVINEEYMDPAIQAACEDGLSPLGQYIYYDALVVHGNGDDTLSFGAIRNAAKEKAKTPAEGGNEATYLNAFLDARIPVMRAETAHADLSRIDAQRKFVKEKKFDLSLPLSFTMYGDPYDLTKEILDKAPDNF